MINSVTLGGNLTSDSTLRSTAGGTGVLSFGMAVNERRKNGQTGEWEDVPSFFDVTLFGSRAEKLAGYLTKGTRVVVVGFLRQSSWEKNGERRSKIEVIADDVMFMSQRNDQQHPVPQAPAYQQAPQQYAAPTRQYAAPMAQMPQAPAYQQQTFYPNQAPMPAQQPDLYDSDIPFD